MVRSFFEVSAGAYSDGVLFFLLYEKNFITL